MKNPILTFCLVCIFAFGSAGCTIQRMVERDKYIRENKDLSPEIAKNISKQVVVPDMSPEMVRAAWGKPLAVDYADNGEEIWVYERQEKGTTATRFAKVHFRKGKVVSIESQLSTNENQRTWDKYTPATK